MCARREDESGVEDKRLGAAVETDGAVDLNEALGVHTRLEVQAVHVLRDEAHIWVHPVCV